MFTAIVVVTPTPCDMHTTCDDRLRFRFPPAGRPSFKFRAEPPFSILRTDFRLCVVSLPRHMEDALVRVDADVALDLARLSGAA